MPISAATTAADAPLPPTVLRGARVLSPGSRDASSLAFDAHGISWIGQDAPGPALFPESAHVDAENAWIAPPFLEAGRPGATGSVADAARLGIDVVTASVPYRPGDAADAGADDGGEAESGLPSPLSVSAAGSGGIAAALAFLDRRAEEFGAVRVAGRSPAIVDLAAADLADLSDARLQALAAYGASLVLEPLAAGTGGVGDVDLIRIATAGVPLACSAWDGSAFRPWDAVAVLAGRARGGAQAPARGLSPRAAFTAATRGAARALLGQRGELGVLRPGAPATFALWRTGELVTVAADDAVQRWSTDPRSGVPPMPDLDAEPPTCLGLVVDGGAAFTAGPLDAAVGATATATTAATAGGGTR